MCPVSENSTGCLARSAICSRSWSGLGKPGRDSVALPEGSIRPCRRQNWCRRCPVVQGSPRNCLAVTGHPLVPGLSADKDIMTGFRLLLLASVGLEALFALRVGAPTDDLTKVAVDELFSIQVTSVGRKAQKISKAPAAVFV